ncbi:hypothetical protein AWB69_00436 [Caballeronia udeis]|uniref:Uncharacterized protein n=2 Tax=Caballeronia udeis TaxID=1232866 RepID=A0A158EZH7_9BURK|nr:hypothetical protein AWB69_00436 [Caballeronia udeis]
MLAKVGEVSWLMVEQTRSEAGAARNWRRLRLAVAVLGVTALLAGCGIFGCGGSATNGGAFGGCGAGMRF